jgi:hypothetical protein
MEVRVTNDRRASVYVLWDGSRAKIGKAVNVRNRVKQLQTGSSRKLNPLVSVELPDGAYEVEEWCKKALKDKNVIGEWFRCSQLEAVQIVIAGASPYLGATWTYYTDNAKHLLRKELRKLDAKEPTTFWDLCRIEPALLDLHAEATLLHDLCSTDFRFCANDHWYGDLCRKLEGIIGWHRPEYHELLSSCAAFEMCVQAIFDALPDCRNCECL